MRIEYIINKLIKDVAMAKMDIYDIKSKKKKP